MSDIIARRLARISQDTTLSMNERAGAGLCLASIVHGKPSNFSMANLSAHELLGLIAEHGIPGEVIDHLQELDIHVYHRDEAMIFRAIHFPSGPRS